MSLDDWLREIKEAAKTEVEEKPPEVKESPFTNWVVEVRTKEGKKMFTRIGFLTKDMADRRAYDEARKLLISRKDRWYEVVVHAPLDSGLPDRIVEF